MFGLCFIFEVSINEDIPLLVLLCIISKPFFTKALFNSFKTTTSQTVPKATRSKKYVRLCSL